MKESRLVYFNNGAETSGEGKENVPVKKENVPEGTDEKKDEVGKKFTFGQDEEMAKVCGDGFCKITFKNLKEHVMDKIDGEWEQVKVDNIYKIVEDGDILVIGSDVFIEETREALNSIYDENKNCVYVDYNEDTQNEIDAKFKLDGKIPGKFKYSGGKFVKLV